MKWIAKTALRSTPQLVVLSILLAGVSAFAAANFCALVLQPKYKGEEKKGVLYFHDDSQRLPFRVRLVSGEIAYQNTTLADGNYFFVLGKDKNIYAVSENLRGYAQDEDLLRHSSLFAGSEVLAAGGLRLKEGQIIYIDDSSGHYHPDIASLSLALKQLLNSGYPFAQDAVVGIHFKKDFFPPGFRKIYLPVDEFSSLPIDGSSDDTQTFLEVVRLAIEEDTKGEKTAEYLAAYLMAAQSIDSFAVEYLPKATLDSIDDPVTWDQAILHSHIRRKDIYDSILKNPNRGQALTALELWSKRFIIHVLGENPSQQRKAISELKYILSYDDRLVPKAVKERILNAALKVKSFKELASP